jgi:uncharacterized protein (TIGR01244 family)
MIRTRLIDRTALAVFLAVLGIAVLAAGTAQAQTQTPSREVPFGDQAGGFAVNYTRLKPNVATAGYLRAGAIPGIKALGFTTIVDLRTPEEGAGTEKKAAEAAGLRYFNIPVARDAPTEMQIAEFARIVEEASNAPLLVHCASANRVGAMWALYRAQSGVPEAIALEEGRTAGMRPDREADVRKRLAERAPTR